MSKYSQDSLSEMVEGLVEIVVDTWKEHPIGCIAVAIIVAIALFHCL